ncbi:TRAP transporter substrate-binding protein [Candidatus Foliamicus sp.]
MATTYSLRAPTASPKSGAGPASLLRAATFLAALLVAGCGGDSEQDAGADKQVVVVGASGAINTPWHEEWLRFERRVKAAAHPGLELQLFVNGQLGTEETILANVRRGRVQYAGLSLHGMSSVVPELSVILAPYLFDSFEEVDFVSDHYLTPLFTEMLAERGLTFIQWSEVGWNHVYCREPRTEPDEFRGVKMRASTAIAPQVFTETIGADNIPLPFDETLPALQTGLVDCGQSGAGQYLLSGIAEEAPHYTLTRHAYDSGVRFANSEWYSSLPEEVRQVLTNALDGQQEGRDIVRRVIAEQEREWQDAGRVSFRTLTDQQRALWREAAQGSHEKLLERIGGRAREVYELILTGKAEFAATRQEAA